MRSENIKKLTCWRPKVVIILIIWISCSSFPNFCFLLIDEKWNVMKWKMILASKLFLLVSLFLVCILYIFSKLQNRLKSCFTCQLFTHGTIEIANEVNTSHFQSEMSIFAISKFRFKSDNSFYCLWLLLSGYISLNPGPFSNPQFFKQKAWQAISNRGLHLIHLNINSLLTKIDELRNIAKRTKAAVIGISESKLDSTVLDPKIYIESYEIFCFGRNRHSSCYLSH